MVGEAIHLEGEEVVWMVDVCSCLHDEVKTVWICRLAPRINGLEAIPEAIKLSGGEACNVDLDGLGL